MITRHDPTIFKTCRMLKKTRLLTRPAPARQDAPFRRQGRSSEADPRFTFHGPYERSENDAGGLFQQPARIPYAVFNLFP